MEDLESVLSGSPGQGQSILRWIMGGDVQDSVSMGTFLQVMDQGFIHGGGGDQFCHNTAGKIEIKPPNFNQQQLVNHHSPNPSFFVLRTTARRGSFCATSGEKAQPGLLPPHLQQPREKMDGGDELGQSILDELYKAVELVQTVAQVIFARLNQQLSPIGKPFYRAAFYVNEALELLLRTNPNFQPSFITY